MNKKIGALITALCMTSGMASYADEVDALYEGDETATDESSTQSHFPDYVTKVDANPVPIKSVCPIWTSEDQISMKVTVKVVGNPPVVADWGDIGGGVSGVEAMTLGDWSLVGVPSTKNSFNMRWEFRTEVPVEYIILNGLAARDADGYVTVFDITHGPEVTPGSMNGYPFTVTAPAGFVADAETALWATYSRPLKLDGNNPPYDLYGVLRIDFFDQANSKGFTGTVELDGFDFRADTDCAMEVDLDSLSAEVLGNQVRVKWRTLSERETDGFKVTRGRETVCDMPSLGDDRHGSTYVCRDSNGSAGDSYELWEVQTDGSTVLLGSGIAE